MYIKFSLFFLFISTWVHPKGMEDAKTYHDNSMLQWQIAMATIDLIPLTESERILDIGCGDGKITALLATKVPKGSVLGIDISQSMIDFASSHYPKADYPNLTFQKQNVTKLAFENQFDRVVSFSTFHWVLDQEKALKAIYRALVPGGSICIHTYGRGVMNVTVLADLLVHTEKWASHFPSYTQQRVFLTKQEYHRLLEQIGFQQIQVIGSWNETPFPNRQALIDFAKPLLNFISHLSPDLQQEFVEDLADKIISIASSSNNEVIHYRLFNLQVLAIK